MTLRSRIVTALGDWLQSNVEMMEKAGIRVTSSFADERGDPAWKANLRLNFDCVLVSYTVWERTILQTELIVVNASKRQTIVVKDETPSGPEIVHQDLDFVLKNLLSGVYAKMEPDPKLVIT